MDETPRKLTEKDHEVLFHRKFPYCGMEVEEFVMDCNGKKVLLWVRSPINSMKVDGKDNMLVHHVVVQHPSTSRRRVYEKFNEYWKLIPSVADVAVSRIPGGLDETVLAGSLHLSGDLRGGG